jgi:N-hydroxyarylamine O-acetyltransferase
MIDVARYLNRINYRGPPDVSADTLRELHKAHLLAVPFENLDIHLGRPIVLEEEKLLRKIVDERRGGFCYELNGTFAALLRALGFETSMLSAGVARDDGSFDPPFDHMALLVKLEERWLADVGFGDSFREPLLLDERGEQVQEGDAHRLVEDGEHLILQRRVDDSWKPQFRFTLEPYEFADYDEMCRYHQTSPDSPFTQHRTCSRATPEGRITLTGMRLIVTEHGDRHERELANQDEWITALREHFAIDLQNTIR